MNNNKYASGNGHFNQFVVGMAVGAAAVILRHAPTRKRFKQGLMNSLEEGDKKLDEVEKVAREKAGEFKEKADEMAHKGRREIKSRAKAAQQRMAT